MHYTINIRIGKYKGNITDSSVFYPDGIAMKQKKK